MIDWMRRAYAHYVWGMLPTYLREQRAALALAVSDWWYALARGWRSGRQQTVGSLAAVRKARREDTPEARARAAVVAAMSEERGSRERLLREQDRVTEHAPWAGRAWWAIPLAWAMPVAAVADWVVFGQVRGGYVAGSPWWQVALDMAWLMSGVALLIGAIWLGSTAGRAKRMHAYATDRVARVHAPDYDRVWHELRAAERDAGYEVGPSWAVAPGSTTWWPLGAPHRQLLDVPLPGLIDQDMRKLRDRERGTVEEYRRRVRRAGGRPGNVVPWPGLAVGRVCEHEGGFMSVMGLDPTALPSWGKSNVFVGDMKGGREFAPLSEPFRTPEGAGPSPEDVARVRS